MNKNDFTPSESTQYHLWKGKELNIFDQSLRPCTFRQKYITGFTLVEMLVVISIIVLVSVVAVPSITPFLKGQGLSKGARIVQASALATRSMAINSRETRRLVFDSIYSKLSIIDDNANVLEREEFLPNNIEFGTSTGTWTVGTSTVSFDPNGTADTTALGTDTVIIQDKQGNTKNLKIISYTGQISSN